jgi:hypothetical protein
MSVFVDTGMRCENHIGEVFAPRCSLCDSIVAEWQTLPTAVCSIHPMSLRPCERCNAA